MKFDERVMQEIMRSDMETLYKHFRLLKNESKELEDEYRRVRFGIEYLFDIHDIFNGMFSIKQKSQLIIMNKISIPIIEWRTELENREDIMRECLYRYGVSESLIKSK